MLHLSMRTSSIFSSQHVAIGCPNACNMLHLTMLRSVAFKCCDRLAGACKCWASNVGICCVEVLLSFGRGFKPRPNTHNISTQHIATLLGATCCARLAIQLWRVAACCDVLGVVGSNLKMVKFFMQHLWMLHYVVVVWPGSCNNVVPGHAH